MLRASHAGSVIALWLLVGCGKDDQVVGDAAHPFAGSESSAGGPSSSSAGARSGTPDGAAGAATNPAAGAGNDNSAAGRPTATGGSPASGATSALGGETASGGQGAGARAQTGGIEHGTGGSASGGIHTGGSAAGGTHAGGSPSGGTHSGGSPAGGSHQGGSATGGVVDAGTGGVDCNCQQGSYAPVCGVDGQTHDATCGIECVPVEIACSGQCPCGGADNGGAGGTGGTDETPCDPADPDGSCPGDLGVCIYQVGGPGPSGYRCADLNECTLSGDACVCGFTPDQGVCNESQAFPGLCVCDNGYDSPGTGECTAAGERGCWDPGVACCSGLRCCNGVPYPAGGQCLEQCTMVSDRQLKRDIRAADTSEVLRGVSRLPISTWSYRAEPDARHIGPMAQDFSASFGMGRSDRVIDAVDASGVALASIQALYQRLMALEEANRALERRVHELEAASGAAAIR